MKPEETRTGDQTEEGRTKQEATNLGTVAEFQQQF
jgi:hypothetical protein